MSLYVFLNWCNWSIGLNMWSFQISIVQIARLKFRSLGMRVQPWTSPSRIHESIWYCSMSECEGCERCKATSKLMKFKRLKGDATLNSWIIGETCQSMGGERLAEKWLLAFQPLGVCWCSRRNAQTDVLRDTCDLAEISNVFGWSCGRTILMLFVCRMWGWTSISCSGFKQRLTHQDRTRQQPGTVLQGL